MRVGFLGDLEFIGLGHFLYTFEGLWHWGLGWPVETLEDMRLTQRIAVEFPEP